MWPHRVETQWTRQEVCAAPVFAFAINNDDLMRCRHQLVHPLQTNIAHDRPWHRPTAFTPVTASILMHACELSAAERRTFSVSLNAAASFSVWKHTLTSGI